MSILGQTGAKACRECGERARAERDMLIAENAELLELVNALVAVADLRDCEECPCQYTPDCVECDEAIPTLMMRELGIEWE